jgi:hypothetical protein
VVGYVHSSICPPALDTARRGAVGCWAILDIGRFEKESGCTKDSLASFNDVEGGETGRSFIRCDNPDEKNFPKKNK